MMVRADRPAAATFVERSPNDDLEPVVEGSPKNDPEAVYRRRHAALEDAGRFVRFVRAGGMGAILLVERDEPGGAVSRFALKLIKEERLGEVEIVERFRRELASHHRLSLKLQVPRLVPCLAVNAECIDPAAICGFFPFYPDGTLGSVLDGGIPAAEALLILADAVEGLQSLHGHDYIHRDFHPSNLFVDREGGRLRGVLGDLGVGMFMDPNTIFPEAQLAEDRKLRTGHPGYTDPRILASPPADLYSVGATLYRILAGCNPLDREPAAAAALTLPEDCPAVGSPTIRLATDRLLARLTAPNPEERFHSAREARVEIVRLAESLQPPGARPPRPRFRRRSRGPRPRSSAGLKPFVAGWRLPALVLAAVVIVLMGYGLGRLRPWDDGVAPEEPPPAVAAASAPADQDLAVTDAPAAEEAQPADLVATGAAVESQPARPQPARPQPAAPETQPAAPEAVETERPEPEPVATQPETAAGSQTAAGSPEDAGDPSAAAPQPRTVAVTPAPAARILEADGLVRRREPRKAEELLRGLLAEHPEDPEVASRLALLLTRSGAAGLDEARTLLSATLARQPERGDLRLALARILHQQARPGDAAALLREAPPGSSHRDEIETLRVTLEPTGDQNR
ncbi:MAG: hypothetical protein GY856_09175 [bacterium]|nr:hypothetical protein [bacterium]